MRWYFEHGDSALYEQIALAEWGISPREIEENWTDEEWNLLSQRYIERNEEIELQFDNERNVEDFSFSSGSSSPYSPAVEESLTDFLQEHSGIQIKPYPNLRNN